MNKIKPMKQYFSATEKNAVEALRNIKPEGAFNAIIHYRIREGKVDTIRILFKEIKQQIREQPEGRMIEVLGRPAVEAVLLT